MEATPDENETKTPSLAILAGAFVAMLCTIFFLLYDTIVRRRQTRLANTAKRSLAIVNSLFPATVRDRLMEKDEQDDALSRRESSFVRKDAGRKANRVANIFHSMAESMAPALNDSVMEDADEVELFNPSRLAKKSSER